jgi:hypothetical protein
MDKGDVKFTDKLNAERVKLKEMNFREKREYIWEYYKIHIIMGAVLVFVIGSLINSWFINPPKEEYLGLGWVSGFEEYQRVDDFSGVLSAALVEDIERQTIPVTTFFSMGDPQADMAMGQRFAAMMAAGQLDVLFLDGETVKGMARNGMILPVEDMLAEAYALDGGLEAKIENAGGLLYAEYNPEEEPLADGEGSAGENTGAGAGIVSAYGIPISASPLYQTQGFFSADLYFCLSASSEKESRAARALAYFYG